jgi:redox-sensitive bicupin YhaK (pirin superfamily)
VRSLVFKTIDAEAWRIPAGDTQRMTSLVRNTMESEAWRIPAGDTQKMQIPVGSPEEGTVKKVFVAPDQFLNEGDPIVELS